MNILLVHQYFKEFNDTGSSRFNEMTKVWGEMGHSITVIAGMLTSHTGEKKPLYGKSLFFKQNNFYPNVNVVRTHVSSGYNKSYIGRFVAYISFVISSIWAGIFKVNGKFDIILVTSPPLFVGFTALALSRLKRTPYIFEIRDLWPESAIDSGIVKNKYIIRFSYWFEQYIYRKAKMINVLTPAFKKNLIEKKGVQEDKIIYIPNAADFSIAEHLLENFDSLEFKKKLGLEGKFVVTYVGAHGVANHLIQLIQTAERMKDTNLIFLLIGDGMQKQMLIKETENKGLKNVKFISSVPKEEIFKYILASDMGASVLKRTDTFKTIYSNKTFDYMSCKKPILLLIDGISRDLIEAVDCGIYAEPENIEEITSQLSNVMDNWDERILKEKGEKGYIYAKKHFDRQILARRYIELIIDAK